MTKRGQDFSMYAGEDRKIEVMVFDEIGAPYNLTGSIVVWEVVRDLLAVSMAELKKVTNDGGITITDPEGGIFTIRLRPDDTKSLFGSYYHEARITDAMGNVSTVLTGSMTVSPTAIGKGD